MKPILSYNDGSTVYNMDSKQLATLNLPPVDAVITDPPYELNMATQTTTSRWDSTGIAFDPAFWKTIANQMKPGAFLFAFGAPRTWHRLACAIEDAGLDIRDQLCWIYASGMPKGEWSDHAIDRALNHKDPRPSQSGNSTTFRAKRMMIGDYKPQTIQAEQDQGRNPSLKPAWEPILVARKPYETTLGRSLLDHGTGALNVKDATINANMVELEHSYDTQNRLREGRPRGLDTIRASNTPRPTKPRLDGRYPSNLLLDEQSASLLPDNVPPFYYCPKASGEDRVNITNATLRKPLPGFEPHATRLGLCAGLEEIPDSLLDTEALTHTVESRTVRIAHPTVKPTSLMRWLVRLATPADGLILDPFLGTGSTLKACRMEGRRCVGVEYNATYLPLIDMKARSTPAASPLF